MVKKAVVLPNHIQNNSIIETRILQALEAIPYDMVLRDFILDQNSITMQLNLLNKDSYIKSTSTRT